MNLRRREAGLRLPHFLAATNWLHRYLPGDNVCYINLGGGACTVVVLHLQQATLLLSQQY